MADVRIVGKALDDFGDDWHWVILHDAEPRGERRYFTRLVDTICGIRLDEGGVTVTLVDTGAPDEPNCPQCQQSGVGPGLRAQIEQVLEEADLVPVRRSNPTSVLPHALGGANRRVERDVGDPSEAAPPAPPGAGGIEDEGASPLRSFPELRGRSRRAALPRDRAGKGAGGWAAPLRHAAPYSFTLAVACVPRAPG